MTHKDLVKLGINYLLNAKRCNPVFAELSSGSISEIPDVIGWTSRDCVVIECKTSRVDMLADYKKSCRHEGKGLGTRRFYLLPKDVYDRIQNDRRFDRYANDGWGRLVAIESASGVRSVRQVRCCDSEIFESNIKAERDFLRSRIMQVQRFGR